MTTDITGLPVPSFAAGFATGPAHSDPGSILLYSEASVGKTTLVGQLIKTPGFNNRGLVIDLEMGTRVFGNDPEVAAAQMPGDDQRLFVLPIDKTQPDAFARLNAVIDEVLSVPFGYDFVALDSLDVAQELAVNWYLENTYNESGKLDTRAAWGKVSEWTSNLAWGFQNTSNFMGVLVGHSKVDEDKKTGQSSVKPKLSGSMRDNIASIPDAVLYMWKEKDENGIVHRVVSTDGDGDHIAKSRFSALPTRLVDTTMPEIFAYLRGQKRGETAA